MSLVVLIVVVIAALAAATTASAVLLWRRHGHQISREARLLMAEQTVASAPHQAVIGWRRSLADAVKQVRRSIDGGRRAGAALGDLGNLMWHLEAAVAGLDRELELLTAEPDPAVVDRVLRTDVGLRAERVLQVAAEIRRAVGRSVASDSSETLDELASSAELSTQALTAALDELSQRPR